MTASDLRRAAVAGQFYSADARRLRAEVEGFLESDGPVDAAVAVVVPHAGLMYSGRVAGRVWARIRIPERVVILAVNHRGRGAAIGGWTSGEWETPLGRVEVDRELMAAIARRAPNLVHDPQAHEREHSLEVQLPFLQVAAAPRRPRIAPISIASHDLCELEDLGHAVAAAVSDVGEPVLLVASTDFSHYEPAAAARVKDEAAMEPILAIDGPRLLRTVLERRISMCGVAATTAALIAARDLGASAGELVAYATSGDVSGDDSSVVGYAGLRLDGGGRE